MRMGAESDKELTAEFLGNTLSKNTQIYREILEVTFNALTPEQQVDALIQLEAIFQQIREADPTDLAIIAEGTLYTIMKVAIVDPMVRMNFWIDFVKDFRYERYKRYDQLRQADPS